MPNFVGKDTLIYLRYSENEIYFLEIEVKQIFAQILGMSEAYLVQIKQR